MYQLAPGHPFYMKAGPVWWWRMLSRTNEKQENRK